MDTCDNCDKAFGSQFYSVPPRIYCSIKCRLEHEEKYKSMTTAYGPVNHPAHYTSHPSGVECITITRHMTFNCGNAVKYLWRNGLKDGAPSVQDLQKAIWYINDEIKRIENNLCQTSM